MALTDENSGGFVATMPMAPAYGGGYGGGFGNGFGGDGWWVLLLLLAFNGGWGGFGGFGGMGGFGGAMWDFPWLINGQQQISNNTNDGFRDAQLHDSMTSVRDGISALSTQLCGCCGDMQMALANGFAGTTAAITGAQNNLSQQMYNNELASLNRSFAEQTANTAGFTGVNSGIADLRYTEATEACATRTAAASNTRDIIDSQTRGTQAILDKLCQLELDGYKRENDQLRSQLTDARFAASQINQTAQIRDGQNASVTALVNELRSCPIPSQPVYGSQPIFTCPNNNIGCGCGCGNASF